MGINSAKKGFLGVCMGFGQIRVVRGRKGIFENVWENV